MEATADISKVKNLEIDILQVFIGICSQLNLQYFVLGGTLLGAVRHQGFIPWDDDIDVCLKRADYNIFIEKAQSMLPEGLFLQTHQTDPEFPMCFAKIRNSNTTFIESSMAGLKINHGVYIDVFPLDYYPEGFLERCVMDFRKTSTECCINRCYKSSKKGLRKLKISAGRLLGWLMYGSIENAVQRQNRLYQAVAKSKWMVNYGGAWGKREIVPTELFDDSTELSFEGIKVSAPKEYDRYLTCIYGDYMTLPPLEEQKPHHHTDLIDPEHPYTRYVQQ